jgi:CRP/FNR family cyclic AMP-dependent transcriptional regulator
VSLIDRFGEDDELVDALLGQEVVRGNREVAEALAASGKLVEFAPGAELVRQGATDTDCYFLLAGKVDLRIKGEVLPYGRGAGDLIGEFRAINSAIPRTATVVATEEVVALKASAGVLKAAGKNAPELWRLIAVSLTSKIEQRNELIEVVNDRPRIFMIAAENRIEIAKALKGALESEYDVDLWSEHDLVPPGGYQLETLREKARSADFGIVFAHPDDLARPHERTGKDEWETVRFELGYLMSELSRHRTLLMVPGGADGTAPGLFKGIQPMTYQLPADNAPLRVVLVAAVDAVRELVETRQVRTRLGKKD